MIIVAGGTGFIGSAVANELLRRGDRVAVAGRSVESIAAKFGDAVEARRADVRDLESLRSAFAGAATVVNAVQFPNSPIENKRKGWTFEQVDYQGTVNQVQAARDAGVTRFVYISGVGAAPDAEQHWFVSKWKAEEAVRQNGIPHVIVRPTWVYGPGDVSLNRFIGLARRLPFVPTFGDGKQPMQPLFIDDLARIVADAAVRPEGVDQTIEAGGPDVMSMNDVITTALEVAGARRPVLHQPVWLGKAMAAVLQLLPGPPLTPDAVDFITHEAVADNTKLQQLFAPRLTPLQEGLRSYLGAQKD
jgi:NADH dehydrogenase